MHYHTVVLNIFIYAPKKIKMEKSDLKKEKCKWVTVANYNETSISTHCYYPKTRKKKWTGEKYEGVSALCNKNKMISDDGENSLSFDELIGENFNGGCQTCKKIYDKLK